MTEGGGSSVSRRQRRLKRDSEDQFQNLKQKCLKMDNPADDAQKNGTDTNNGLLPGTSGQEKCIMIEGYKYFFGEKGMLLRAEPMDKADLEKLQNPEEKRALEKKMAREWKRIAKAAIAYHNHQERVNFKLVKVVECKTISDHGIWYHLNFEAKPRDYECSPKLFFAELYGNALRVTCCCMLKSKGSDASTMKGCLYCGSLICHPASGFRAGSEFALRFNKYGGIPVNCGQVFPQS